MPGKSQSYSDAVLNVLHGMGINGASPFLGLLSVAPADDSSAGAQTQPWSVATPMRISSFLCSALRSRK